MARIAGNQTNPDRSPTDLYPTDGRWAEALLREVEIRGPVWECAAGEGHIVRVLDEWAYDVRATDVLTGQDFLAETEPWAGSIVTNPPYRLAAKFVAHALELAAEQVAMLVRLDFLGGQGRLRTLWNPRPPALVLVVANRMVVHGNSSQFTHAWVVWDRAADGPTRLIWASVK